MTKQLINIGETANDRKGDSLRAAFTKINDNFTDLYTALGLNADVNLNLGAFEFAGSVMTTTDSTPIVIDQSVTVSSDLTIGGDLLPNIANGGNLGSLAKPFRSLYVSTNTVFLGGVPLSLEAGTNELTINNVPISQTINFTDITGQSGLYKPDSITDYRSGSYYNSIAVPAGSVIIDHATYRWATDSGASAYRDTVFQPSVYSATINESGNITDIQITTARSYPNPDIYPDFINYEIVNTDNMVAIDSGIDITDPVAIAASSMFEILLAGVTSIAKPIPTDISELEDIGGLLGGGGTGGSGDSLVNGDSSFSMSPDGTLTLTHPDEPNYHPLSTILTIQKAAGNYHTISGAYGLSLQATPVPSGYGLDTNTNFVDIFHDGISVNVNDNTWGFGTDGTLTLPPTNIITAALSQQVGTIITDIEAWNWHNGTGNPYTWNQWNPEFLSLYNIGDSIIGWSFYSDADPSNVVTITARNPDISELTFSGDLGNPPYVAQSPDYSPFHGNPVVIQTQGPQFQANWSFGADGNLTFPDGDITIGHDPYGGPAIIGAAGKSIAMIASGAGEVEGEIGSSLIWVDSITEPTKIAGVTANNPLFAGAGDVGIVTGDYGEGSGSNLWNFSANGNLTLPGDIRSEGNINIDINLSDSTLRRWQFGEDGILTLPAGGDILNSSGQSVLGGGSYTPDDSDNWDSPTVNTVTAALDELAARVTALQNFEIDGGNANTPELGELIIDGNNGA